MPLVQVHNITDRPNTPGSGRAFMIGGQKLRPGKFTTVDDSTINQKLRDLHGSMLWIGDLPNKFSRTSQSAQAARERAARPAGGLSSMTYEEAYAYLNGKSPETLREYCQAMSPELSFETPPPQPVLVKRVARALFTVGRVLDPAVFFWLRRWVRNGDTYVELEEEE